MNTRWILVYFSTPVLWLLSKPFSWWVLPQQFRVFPPWLSVPFIFLLFICLLFLSCFLFCFPFHRLCFVFFPFPFRKELFLHRVSFTRPSALAAFWSATPQFLLCLNWTRNIFPGSHFPQSFLSFIICWTSSAIFQSWSPFSQEFILLLL